MFLAICYREASPEKLQEFREEVKSEGKMTEEMGTIFESLAKPNPEKEAPKKKKMKSNEIWYGIFIFLLSFCHFTLTRGRCCPR